MEKINLAISGSRSIKDKNFIFKILDYYLSRLIREYEITILHGGAVGVDTIADNWAKINKIKTEIFKPEYDKYPPKVAPIKRNQTIVDNADYLLAITTGSNGTASTIKMADKKGINIRIVKYENSKT